MKEIRFRLIENNKIVGYEKHLYLKNPLNEKASSVYIYHSKTGHEMSWKNISMNDNEKCYIRHDKKEMFTTLCDKNGKEIYEGDLIRNDSGRVCTIKWHEYCGCWDALPVKFAPKDNADGFDPVKWKQCVEIISNPELLKEIE